jgi:Zn-dependent protease with chaperone function
VSSPPLGVWQATEGTLPPFDRESFLLAQQRNRRTTWRLTAIAYLAVVLVSLTISVLLSPLLLGAIVVVTDLLGLILPVPNVGGMLWTFIDRLSDDTVVLSTAEIVRGLLLAASPGLLFAGLGWMGLRRLFSQCGPDAVARSMGARELNRLDFEEQQLGNVVEEMAIAANIKPPCVLLYDGGTINGAAFGRGTEEAVLVVSRLALDSLSRAETQALCGHLVATVANGDVRIGGLVISVLQMCGFTRLLTLAMFERHAREVIWRLLRGADAQHGLQLMSELVAYATMEEKKPAATSTSDGHESTKDKIVQMLKLPFMGAQLIGGIMLPMLTSFLLLPLFAFSWRARRYLADSAAVQLTRDPDALSKALAKLGGTGVGAPGPSWVQHLFVAAGRSGSVVTFHPEYQKRVNRLARMGGGLHFKPPSRSPKELALGVFVISPLMVLVGVLMSVALFLMGVVNLMLSMLFLMPVVGILHLLLRWPSM